MQQKDMKQKEWWKELHWPEYGAELVGTAFLILVGLSAVVFDFGKGLPMSHLVPSGSLRLLITGLIFAGSGSLVAISPFGKLSGAHINPSVSLAFLVQGKMHLHDFFGYIIGQFLGAILGEVILVLAWGSYAASVHNGMTLPGAGYPLWLVFLAETIMTFLLVFLIFVFVSSHRLMHWTPLMNWILVATMVWQEAPISGTSLNPARSFAPALLSGYWHDQWIYWIAPPLGGLLAVGVFRLLSAGERDVLTGKLFHVPHYRSVFKNVAAQHLPANGKLKKAPDAL
jgi:aquaporin Z